MSSTTIVSGQSVTSGFTVTSGNTLVVLPGGVATGITIASGGTADLGGTDSGTSIETGGLAALTGSETNITIASGGTETVNAGTITGGQVLGLQQIASGTGAQIFNETIGNGGTLDIENKSNTVTSTTIATGGTFIINGNAAGNGIVIAGGTIELESPKANLTDLTFSGAGTLVDTSTISAGTGGVFGVIQGFGSGDVIDLSAIGTGATLTTFASGPNTIVDISGGSTEGSESDSFTFSGTGSTYALSTDGAGTGAALTGTAGTSSSGTDILTEFPTLTSFTAGDIVISVVGGVDGNTYTDNQATPVVLEEIDPTNGSIVGVMELPQSSSGNNSAFSGEYGSSSEGILQLAANGQSLVIAGYGVNATTFNAGEENGNNIYGDAALAQSTSIEGGTLTAVSRVIADISFNGSVDTSTALFNVFNTNNPRSVATVDGSTFYISGQGVKGDTTQGVFVASDGASSATSIDDATDTRTVEIFNGQLYVSIDSTQDNTSEIASLGTLPTGATVPTVLSGIQGTDILTAAQENAVNAAAVGTSVALSPEEYFFANATTLYVADGGIPKAGGVGDGGLQKWTLNPQTGTWTLDYTISAGLNLVQNTAASGTTGLIGLSGQVNANGTVTFYATNATIGDLDQTFLYTITDNINATTLSGSESFSVVETAAADTNIRGIAAAPSAPTNTTIASGTTATGLIISTGSILTVASGGTLDAGVVNSGGTVEVDGTDIGSLIQGAGEEDVIGSASGDTVWGLQVVSGAVSDETVSEGGVLRVVTGTATNTIVDIDSQLQLGFSATDVTLNSGTVVLESEIASISGTLALNGDGNVLDLTMAPSSGHGVSALITGFNGDDAIQFTVFASIDSAATLSSATAGGDTVETVSEGSLSTSFTFAGDFVPNSFELATLASGGEELVLASTITGSSTVASGQIAENATIASGGTVTVLSGGSLVSGDILSGGTALVSGFDSGSTIAAGGTELINAGTVTGDLVLGLQQVPANDSGAMISNEAIGNGGTLDIENKSNTVTSTTIETGGTFIINGNAAGNDIVLAGGTIELESPKANLTDLTFSGAGTLVDTSTISAGTGGVFGIIQGFGSGDVIDLSAIGTGASLTSSTDGTNTTISISGGSAEGVEVDNFTFAGTFAPDFFSLSNNGVLSMNGAASPALTISSGETAPANFTVTNAHTLDVLVGGTATGVLVASGGLAEFSGTDSGTTIQDGGTVILTGTETNITIASGGTETVEAGTITGGDISGFQQALTNTTGALISNETIENGGTLLLDNKSNTVVSTTIEAGGIFAINGNASGNSMVIAGGTIELDSPKANLTDLTFSGAGTLLDTSTISAGTGGVFNVIQGFGSGDVIDLSAIGSGATTSSTTDGTNTTISISGGSTEGAEVDSFTFSGTGLQFALSADQAGTGEALQEVFCYLPGTQILTPSGQAAVETLKIGDALVTRFGGIRKLKWIGIQRYSGRFLGNNPDLIPVCIKANALGEGLPLRDLYVSPGHSMLVEDTLLLAKNLVNGITVVQEEPPELVEYYTLEFDAHDCVIAEGMFSESYADVPGLRNRFHNVAEFHALYPDYVEPEALRLCAPRPESGPALDAALRPLAARAAALSVPGPLQGFVERVEANGLIEGWAQDIANPELPVLLDIFLGGKLLGSALACDYRIDLRQAGIGRGHARFSFQAPKRLSPAQRAAITVRRHGDGAVLGLLPNLRASA